MRLRWVVVALACAGVVVWMLVGLRDNVVYLVPVSEAVTERDDDRTRVGGSVVPGSIQEDRDAGAVAFDLSEGGEVMHVVHEGAPPDLFGECAPAVVEGAWDGDTFRSDRLLIRHGNEYAPPSAATPERCEEMP